MTLSSGVSGPSIAESKAKAKPKAKAKGKNVITAASRGRTATMKSFRDIGPEMDKAIYLGESVLEEAGFGFFQLTQSVEMHKQKHVEILLFVPCQ